MAGKDVVVVTGSSGMLGQHIVKLLQEKDDSVEEIRLFDVLEYRKFLDYKENKPMKVIAGDVTDFPSLLNAFDGANCVIHTAAVIDINMFPDVDKMTQVNVNGTKNVIDACIMKNVPVLLYASSTGTVEGHKDLFNAEESKTPCPKVVFSGHYGKTKCEAEKLVLKANGKLLSDGKNKLRTLAIRPPTMYGEEEHAIKKAIRVTEKNNGLYIRIGSMDSHVPITYAGNVAWCFLKAKERVKFDEHVCGETFFVTDNRPPINYHDHLQPYLESKGLRLSKFIIPYWIAYIFIMLIESFLSVVNIFKKVSPDLPSMLVLTYFIHKFTYSREKAEKLLHYQPLYTPEESDKRTVEYFAKLKL